MRIRKLAKLHGYNFCNNNAGTKTDSITSDSPPPFLQSHICQFNQSPWDVVTFSPDSPSSPFQVDGDGDGHESQAASFVDSTGGAVESTMNTNISVGGDIVESSNANNNNRQSLRKGNRRPREKPAGGNRIPTTDSYDFYYYSGFGPRWGKKRGSRNEIGVTEAAAELGDELINGGGGGGCGGGEEGIDIEEDDDYNGDEREVMMKKKKGRKAMKARSLKSFM